MSYIFDCSSTFMTLLPQCFAVAHIATGIEADGEYEYRLITPHNKIYVKTVTVTDGAFDLLAADFPDGLFNPWIGPLYLQLFQGNSCEPVQFTICGELYSTIGIHVKEMVNAAEPFELICECGT